MRLRGGVPRAENSGNVAPGRGALSGPRWDTTPRELPFERGDPIAKRSVRGFLIAQSLAEVEGNDHENSERSGHHAFTPEVPVAAHGRQGGATVDPAPEARRRMHAGIQMNTEWPVAADR